MSTKRRRRPASTPPEPDLITIHRGIKSENPDYPYVECRFWQRMGNAVPLSNPQTVRQYYIVMFGWLAQFRTVKATRQYARSNYPGAEIVYTSDYGQTPHAHGKADFQ